MFLKEGAVRDVFNQGLAQPTSDYNLSVHALCCERKHPIVCPTDVLLEVQVLVNQPIKDVLKLVVYNKIF
ncbi:MAG: hypothetical protein IKS33_02280 [Bacteroidales bacterium]|nr:hypothetical protein [Bacteroidales bacterium]